MSTQQTDSAELGTILAADSSAPSLATCIPPELFKNILAYVGDERLGPVVFEYSRPSSFIDPDTRRKEMKHLSACALTCVYWARLTRGRMFATLVLRSSKDIPGLLSLLRAPQSPRIPPICDILRCLDVYYTLGDHPWFHNLIGLASNRQVSRLWRVSLTITGPATRAFVAASTRGSMLHPLFFATPRVLPIIFPKSCDFYLSIINIYLPNLTVLSNLLQDCLSLRPHDVECTNLTWDVDPVLQATPSSIGLKYACHTANIGFDSVSRCTDNVLVATMLKSVPHHEFFQRRQGPYLDPLETSFLFDVMRTSTTRCGLQLELQRIEMYTISSNSDPDSIQKTVMPAVRLPVGTDFCLEWRLHPFVFICITSRLLHPPANSNNVRVVTYIVIDLCHFNDHFELRRHMKTANIDWDTFLHTVRQFPHLRQVVIQSERYITRGFSRQKLVEFLAHLGDAWFDLGELLGLYYKEKEGEEGQSRFRWVQLQLDTAVTDEIKQKRAEIKDEYDAEKAASSELESNVVAEGTESSTHTGNE